LDESRKITYFADFIKDKVGKQRKKIRLCESNDVYECLYMWFQMSSKTMPIDRVYLYRGYSSQLWGTLEKCLAFAPNIMQKGIFIPSSLHTCWKA
jgi:hypothetical protein